MPSPFSHGLPIFAAMRVAGSEYRRELVHFRGGAEARGDRGIAAGKPGKSILSAAAP
jgi:hypothetical protein